MCRLPLHGIIKKYQTNVDAKGEWKLSLQTPVAGGPYSITFSDGEDLTLQNILIGEVWFCSGQSNMEMPVKRVPRTTGLMGSQPYIVSANPKRPLRLYTVKNNWSTTLKEEGIDGQWSEASSEEVADFSATAYYFATSLSRALRIPVGIISSAYGGATVEGWISRELLENYPDISPQPRFHRTPAPHAPPHADVQCHAEAASELYHKGIHLVSRRV